MEVTVGQPGSQTYKVLVIFLGHTVKVLGKKNKRIWRELIICLYSVLAGLLIAHYFISYLVFKKILEGA